MCLLRQAPRFRPRRQQMSLGDGSPNAGQRRIHGVHARAEVRLPLLGGDACAGRCPCRPALGVRLNPEPSRILSLHGSRTRERNDPGTIRTGLYHHAPLVETAYRPPTLPTTRGSRGCRVLDAGYTRGGRLDAVLKPNAGIRRGVAAHADSRQSITTTVYIPQGVSCGPRRGLRKVPADADKRREIGACEPGRACRRRGAFAASFCPCWTSVETTRCLRLDDKSRRGERLQAISGLQWSTVRTPGHVRTPCRNGCCGRQSNPRGSVLYIQRGIYLGGTILKPAIVREVVRPYTERRGTRFAGTADCRRFLRSSTTRSTGSNGARRRFTARSTGPIALPTK